MFITQPRAKKNVLGPPPKRKRKAATAFAVEEISFDDEARADYLTGFHKRKVQRQKQAQEIAVEKARQERIAFRKQVRDLGRGDEGRRLADQQIREQRKEAMEEHVQQVNEALRAARVAGGEEPDDDDEDDDDSTSWDGIADEEPPAFVDHMAEYVDEQKFTTVTVDAVSVDRDGMHRLNGGSSDEDEDGDGDGSGSDTDKKDKKPKHDAGVGAADGAAADKGGRKKKEWPAKTKKKKFRYESKIERQLSKQKQKRGR